MPSYSQDGQPLAIETPLSTKIGARHRRGGARRHVRDHAFKEDHGQPLALGLLRAKPGAGAVTLAAARRAPAEPKQELLRLIDAGFAIVSGSDTWEGS
jgi:hypothetical protein